MTFFNIVLKSTDLFKQMSRVILWPLDYHCQVFASNFSAFSTWADQHGHTNFSKSFPRHSRHKLFRFQKILYLNVEVQFVRVCILQQLHTFSKSMDVQIEDTIFFLYSFGWWIGTQKSSNQRKNTWDHKMTVKQQNNS